MPHFNHIRLLRYASLFTYACVGIPLLQYDTVVAEMLERARPAYFYDLWLGCYLAFGLVFWFLTHDMGARNPSGLRRLVQIALLVLLNLLAIAVGWLSQSGLCALLLVVVSVALPWILNLQVGVTWMVLQNFSLLPLFASWPTYSLSLAAWQATMYLGISTTTFVTSLIAKQQAEAREDQRRLNAELRATRALLAESSRLGERMRISRELHDLVGHHLTALSLNLEVASHLVSWPGARTCPPGPVRGAPAAFGRARGGQPVARGRQHRSDRRPEYPHRRRSGIAHPSRIAAAFHDRRSTPGPIAACVAPRKSSPMRSAMPMRATCGCRSSERRTANWPSTRAMTDVAPSSLRHGNGLTGMRERLSQFGGQLDIVTAKDQGFSLDAWLPMEATQ